jgi:hypothetical protein
VSLDFAQAARLDIEDEAAELVGVIEERVRLHPGDRLPEVVVEVGEGQRGPVRLVSGLGGQLGP